MSIKNELIKVKRARFVYKGKARSVTESAVSRSKILYADRRVTENTFWSPPFFSDGKILKEILMKTTANFRYLSKKYFIDVLIRSFRNQEN